MALFPDTDKGRATILERLERFNTTLATKSWRVFSEERLVKRKEMCLMLGIAEFHIRAFKFLHFRPYFDLGRVTFRMADGSKDKLATSDAGDGVGHQSNGT